MMYFQINERYSWKVIVLIHLGTEPQEVASIPLLMSKGSKRKGKEWQLKDAEKLLSRQQIVISEMLHL